MFKKALLTIVAALALAAIPLSSVGAWSATLSGYGKCQPDGSFLITWKLHNHEEHADFTVSQSSNELVVPVGTKVAGDATSNFMQTVDGTKAGTYNLSLTGSWTGSEEVAHPHADVELEHACKQPATITVNKQTDPANDKTVFSVTISPVDPADGQVFGAATQSISGGGSVVFKVAPGTYNVTEATMNGWTQTSNNCKNIVIVGPGAHNENDTNIQINGDSQVQPVVNKDCTIVNTKNPTEVLSSSTTTQATAPTGGVSAGLGGGSASSSVAAALGLVSSIIVLGLGLRRLNRQV